MRIISFVRCRAVTIFIFTALLLSAVGIASALDPKRAMTQYVHTSWTSNEGLPQDSINAIAQTPDGYLWLATQEGLARFDGARFTIFDPSNTEGLGSFIYTILTDQQGTLWIGSGGGLAGYRNGQFTRFTRADGLFDVSAKNISEGMGGVLWLGAGGNDRVDNGSGLTKFSEGRGTILETDAGLSNNQIYKTLTDRKGNLWVATGNGLNLYKDGRFIIYTIADGLSSNYIKALCEDRAGNLWIGTGHGLNRFKDGKFTTLTAADSLSNDSIETLYEDEDGNLWIGTENGLDRLTNGKLQSAAGIDGIANDRIFAIFEDRENSLWIGTHTHGLHRLRDGKFTTYGTAEGLSGSSLQSIYQDSAQRIWLGTADGGLNVLENNQFKTFSTKNGLLSARVRAILEDRASNLWFGTEEGLNKFSDGRFTSYTTANGLINNRVRSIYEDTDGALWIGTTLGLSIFKDGKFKNFDRSSGVLGSGVNFVYRTRAGTLYVAGDEGLSIYHDGALIAQKEGFPKGDFNPQSIYEDADGALWITTWGQGLIRVKEGKVTIYTTKDGIYDNTAWSILADDTGNLWLGCNRGVYRLSLQELNDFAGGKIHAVKNVVYGTINGMRSRETNAGSPSAIRAKDGRLWFATQAGAATIDPNNIITNPVAPLVVIEKLIADDNAVEPNNQNFELAAGTKNIEFQYVGLSLVAQDRVKYKYKIEGFDQDWIDAGSRRAAYYTNLPPGDYSFRIIAANNDGIWNEEGVRLKFRVLTPFWRTWWFTGLALMAVAGIVFLVFKWRISRLQRANAQQTAFSRRLIETQEDERQRIAAELHDNLGQQLVVIRNWAALGLKFTDKDAPVRSQLEEISETALLAIGEVREIIYDLRPLQLESAGLTNTIKYMVEQIAASSGIAFIVESDDLDDFFAPEVEVIFYRIVQECVSNAVKHSEAARVQLTIRRSGTILDFIISDDGKGFISGAQLPDDTRPRGFGLTSLNERVHMLGGTLEIDSTLEKGTTVIIKGLAGRESS